MPKSSPAYQVAARFFAALKCVDYCLFVGQRVNTIIRAKNQRLEKSGSVQ